MGEVVKIVADTGGGFIDGIEYVPFEINLKDDPSRSWFDTKDMPPEVEAELNELNKTPGALATSQPAPGRYKERFQEVFDKGADRIISIAMSRGLSGSQDSNEAAAAEINNEYGEEGKVLTIDSLSVSVLQRFIEEEALRLVEQGDKSPEEIKQVLETMRNDIYVGQVFSKLRHLLAGGRGENAIKDLLGNMMLAGFEKLGLNAVVSLGKEDGKVVEVGKKFGAKAMTLAFTYIAEQVGDKPVDLIVASYDVEENKRQKFIATGKKILNVVSLAEDVEPWVLRVHTGGDALVAGARLVEKSHTKEKPAL